MIPIKRIIRDVLLQLQGLPTQAEYRELQRRRHEELTALREAVANAKAVLEQGRELDAKYDADIAALTQLAQDRHESQTTPRVVLKLVKNKD